MPAVVGAGFDTSSFVYIGFLPQKKGRQTALKTALQSQIPTFFYESVHRMPKLLEELQTLNFKGKILIAREISKLFEEFQTFSFDKIQELHNQNKLTLKGEFVIGIYA